MLPLSQAILVALILGAIGSVGHCAVMCGAVQVLLARRGMAQGWRLGVLHAGRVVTYSLLGALVGALGGAIPAIAPAFSMLQGVVAVILALLGGYLAISLLGAVPSPELLLSGAARRWGWLMQRITPRSQPGMALTAATGLAWGLLPCGFVLTALVPAASSGSAPGGAAVMAAFGVGTLPALLLLGAAVRGRTLALTGWARPVAALVVMAFAAQMALRGAAAWEWVNHLMVAGIMVW